MTRKPDTTGKKLASLAGLILSAEEFTGERAATPYLHARRCHLAAGGWRHAHHEGECPIIIP